jgi:branched-chain amino acid transport system substrate-binding protein
MMLSSGITSAHTRSRQWWAKVSFGPEGEWAQSRVLQVQYRSIKGNDIAQFKDMSSQVVVAPPQYASGVPIYSYERAK